MFPPTSAATGGLNHEVRALLDDIRESNGATYYLQPLVVKGREDGSWELVDGQQRLTTLYLIFKYLRRTHLPSADIHYSIAYQTREGSKDYPDRLSEADAGENLGQQLKVGRVQRSAASASARCPAAAAQAAARCAARPRPIASSLGSRTGTGYDASEAVAVGPGEWDSSAAGGGLDVVGVASWPP